MFSRCARRFASAGTALVKPQRFYKEVGIVSEAEAGVTQFKVTVDGRVIKTRGGKPLQMTSEPLAMAVAEEWASQADHIEQGLMRLTGLAMTAIDNPLHMTKESITEVIMEYLATDTVLFFAPENELLMEAQQKHWMPVIADTNKDMGTTIQPVVDFVADPVSDDDRRKFESWLRSYNFWALTGMQYAVQSAKSVLIPLGMVRHRIGAREAAKLSMLEQVVQTEQWGQVEWAHGIDDEELCSRLSAAALFVYLNSNNLTKKTIQ